MDITDQITEEQLRDLSDGDFVKFAKDSLNKQNDWGKRYDTLRSRIEYKIDRSPRYNRSDQKRLTKELNKLLEEKDRMESNIRLLTYEYDRRTIKSKMTPFWNNAKKEQRT